jgi:hypothetical protein
VAGLVLAVTVGHLGVADVVVRRLQELALAQAMPARIEVAYVREMALAPPPVRVAAAPPPAKRRAAAAPVAASAVEPAEAPPAPAPEPAPVEAPTVPEPAAEVEPPASAPAASSPAVPPFEWPVSTRLRYVLTGNFRGEVHGQAQVEWIRVAERYQVHLDVSVGFLASRRMSSDGEITPEGLAPRRYDQQTQLVFSDPQRSTVRFEGDQVLLANGKVVPRGPGVQDTVSQFVQLTWLFDSQPERLRVGSTVEIPLAMPRNVSIWVYDVVEEETLYTPFGELQAFHLKPRREPRAGGDMTVDIWIAPQLRHLPVRFRIRPDAEAYFDLMLDRRPELATSERPQLNRPTRSPP